MRSKERRLPDWVQDIRDAMQDIESDIGTETETEFLADGKTLRAVVTSLTNIGEAARKIMEINPDLQLQNPAVWQHLRVVYAMKNVLTHGYFRTDASVAWETVKNDLPKLESLLATITPGNDGGDDGSGGGVSRGPK